MKNLIIGQAEVKAALDGAAGQMAAFDRLDGADNERQEAIARLQAAVKEGVSQAGDERLWEALKAFQNHPFYTAKKLEYSYILKGNEMFVSRKDKSITKATILLSFHNALNVQEQEGRVSGPKKLGTFGASYLYPVFLMLGIITA